MKTRSILPAFLCRPEPTRRSTVNPRPRLSPLPATPAIDRGDLQAVSLFELAAGAQEAVR